MLQSILIALAPHLLDLIIDIIAAEKDPVLDTGYKKHDKVIGNLQDKVKTDKAFNDFDGRDVMNVANDTIEKTVKRLNEKGVFKKNGS
jgi:hypothetical protein